jgi:hypothetical protein
MKAALLVCLLAVIAIHDAVCEPLTIKGLAPGDSPDKISLLGVCDVGGRSMCVGKTTYGEAPASFNVALTAGRVDHVMVTFGAGRSPEVLAGLTKRFGPPNGPTGCKPEARCTAWNADGVRLTLFEDLGSVWLTRASPAGGY